MCGIVALKTITEDVSRYDIKGSLDSIRHRGPDGYGIYLNKQKTTALAHTRLSVIDLQTGNQPIVNQQYGVSLVINGELYDYKNIRNELQKKGYTFQTNSDSEILIFLYLEYGLDLFKCLRGEFAFVLYDEKNDMLLAARDRFGIKPLCFYKDENRLLIASKAKALFKLGITPEWDEYSLMHAANMHYQPTNRTLFKNIWQLQPGHFLIFRNQNFSIHKYWDLNYPKDKLVNHTINETECIETFRSILEQSVKLRLQSDVPVCFHLSGGLDSSSIVGLAAKHITYPMHCFTISFDGISSYDETLLAKETAKLTNATLHTINVTQEDIFNNLADAVYYSEGLAVNGHLSCKYLLNKSIKKNGFKVALTGEGSDEVLAGYPHLRLDIFNQLPPQQRQKYFESLYKTNLAVTGVEIAQGESLNVEKIQERLGFVPSFLTAKASIGLKMHSVLSDEYLSQYAHTDFYDDMINSYDVEQQLKGRHIVNQSLYLWTKLTLANYILNTLGDGCEMSSSVEGRLPFLDHTLFEYVKNLPMDMKIRNGIEKYILKEAVKPFVTEHVYKRQKHPFMAPPVTRFKTEKTIEYVHDTLKSASFNKIPYFDGSKIEKLLKYLDTDDVVELTAYEPVVMFLLTAACVQKKLIDAL